LNGERRARIVFVEKRYSGKHVTESDVFYFDSLGFDASSVDSSVTHYKQICKKQKVPS